VKRSASIDSWEAGKQESWEAGKQESWEAGKPGGWEAMRPIIKMLGCKKDKRPEILENSISLLASKHPGFPASKLPRLPAFLPPSYHASQLFCLQAFRPSGFPASELSGLLAFRPPSILKGLIHAHASFFKSRSLSRCPGIA